MVKILERVNGQSPMMDSSHGGQEDLAPVAGLRDGFHQSRTAVAERAFDLRLEDVILGRQVLFLPLLTLRNTFFFPHLRHYAATTAIQEHRCAYERPGIRPLQAFRDRN